MSVHHKVSGLVLTVCLLATGCGAVATTPTAAPATATPVAQRPTDTPRPPTATPITPTPTNTPRPPTETPTVSPTATPRPMATATAKPAAVEAKGFTLDPRSGMTVDAWTYGGRLTDWGYDVLLLDDGGTLIVGQADNTGLSHRITPGKARLIRTDAGGDVLWQRDYGGEDDALFYCPIQTGEDEYVILGQIAASYARDEEDIYLVKIDGQGHEIWSRTYGGRGMDAGKMVRQTADGGFIVVGDRADEVPKAGLYQSDLVLIKTDVEGNEVWTRTYGEEILHVGWGVAQTPDGGYIVAGWAAKTIADRDVIALKTDANGEVEWSRSWDLDPGDRDGGFDMILTAEGHAIIAGIASMDDGPRRAVLIKVDLEGNEVWVKEYDAGSEGCEFWDIMEDGDGGYVMAGGTFLTPFDPATGEAVRGGFIVKTDPDGEVLWQHTVGSAGYESTLLSSAVVVPERGYLFVGAARPEGEKHWDMLWLRLALPGQLLAFTSNRADGEGDIYLMNPEGIGQGHRNLQRLTDDPAYDAWPSWSPDGSQIAFMSTRSGNPDIYVMNVDGSNVRQLTDHPANDIWPEWSPDGTRIAFPSRRDGNFEIYVIGADGTNLQRLTNTPGHEDFPTWSPDGTQLVFSRVEGNDGTFVMDVPDGPEPGSGTERRLLDFVVFEPAWSPDGARIAFASDHEGFRAIYVMDADGGNVQRLSTTRAGENCPAWSPNGTRMAFASWRDWDGEIYVMDADGSNLQQLTDNVAEDEFPAWQPAPSPGDTRDASEPGTEAGEGEPVAFEGKVDVGGYEMYLSCTGSGTPTVILEAGYDDVAETWSLVQPEIAGYTRVCAYDRAGLGQSDPGPEPRNSLQMVKELHALLDGAGIEGPYVLVGHSLGGMYARLFADRYQGDVAGLVLVDSSHIDQFWHNAAVLPPESPGESESLRFYREWFTNPPTYPTLPRRLFESGSLGELPLVVLTSPVKERADDLPPGLSAKWDEIWVELQEEWAQISSNSTHVIAHGSSHFIQHDRPDLVIEAILQVVEDARQ